MRITIKNSSGQNILGYLRDNNIYLPAACGGRGTCGKCGVRVINGAGGTEDDALPAKDVLACRTAAADGMIVEIPGDGKAGSGTGFKILNAYVPQRETVCDKGGDGSALAIDIGTTTLAFELLDRATGKRLAAHSAVNRQRIFGADVISRIAQAVNGKNEKLHNYIAEDIAGGIAAVGGEIKTAAVTGNTTMLHLFRNYPCDTLGVYPFTPVSVAMEKYFCGGCEVTVLPGVSAFAGADVMAGIVFCGEPSGDGFDLLIDLGTNCEMALYNKTTVLVTAAAAGPAFEAGNISCGTGSVPGAVARVAYLPKERVYAYKTIDDQPPVGICGSGAVDITAQLALHGIIDETGLLREEFFETGVTVAPGVIFTQKDIRQMQLAKSAVRAGIEILLKEAGADYGGLRRVLLAGGFGHKIDLENAAVLGIIPGELKNKVTAVGNSALGGAARVLLNRRAEDEILDIAARAKEINLSGHPLFNDLFMEHMAFTREPEGFAR